MSSPGNIDQNVIAFATDRNKTNDTYVSELLKGLVASFKDLERKNRELEQRNTELVSALQQSNDKIANLEQFPEANPELSKMALKAAAEILESAEEAVGAVRLAAKAQSNDRYQETTGRLLELQRQMISLLEATREENARRDQEANEQALNILLGSKKSILSMAEELDSSSSESKVAHVPSTNSRTEVGSIGSQLSAESLVLSPQDPAPRTQHPALSTQNPEPRTQNPEPRTQNPEPRTQNPGLSTQDSGLSTHHSQTVELIASPFRNFSNLYSFQQTVQKLPGVIEVKAQSFAKGTLRLRIKRRSTLPLSTQLSGLSDFHFKLVSEEENRVEISLSRL